MSGCRSLTATDGASVQVLPASAVPALVPPRLGPTRASHGHHDDGHGGGLIGHDSMMMPVTILPLDHGPQPEAQGGPARGIGGARVASAAAKSRSGVHIYVKYAKYAKYALLHILRVLLYIFAYF